LNTKTSPSPRLVPCPPSPYPHGLPLYYLRNPHFPLPAVLHPIPRDLFLGTQHILSHNFTLPLETYLLGGDSPSWGVPFLPIGKFFPLLREHPSSSSRSSFHSLGEPLLGECHFSPLGSSYHSLRESLPKERPFSLPINSFCCLREPFLGNTHFPHMEVPFVPWGSPSLGRDIKIF
jgi:hypothetical protein